MIRSVLLALLLVGCDADGSGDRDAEAPSYRFPPLPDVQSCRFDGQAPGALPRVVGRPAFEDHRFERPVQAFALPDGRMAVVERGGRVLAVGDAVETLADVRGAVFGGDDAPGLTSAAVHPASGRLFALYATGPETGAVAELVAGGPPRVLAEVPMDGGGHLLLGPDEALYATTGDLEGVAPDRPRGFAGVVLRVTLEGATSVWARGLRDPWRCAFGPADALWCGDAGVEGLDEINVVQEGAHHGWPTMLGRACRTEPCDPARFSGPLHRFIREPPACGVVGGVHYTGRRFPALANTYLFADRCEGRVRALRTTRVGVSEVATVGRLDAPVAHLATDAAGELYAVHEAEGRVTRLEVPDPEPGFPTRLSESGCFSDLPSLTPAPGVVPYDVNAALWTDGAIKDRHLAIPPGTEIERAVDGAWRFPTGSVLLKSFSGPARPIETRVMVRRELDWAFHTYRWNDEGTDAVLLTERVTVDVELPGVEGISYLFPDRAGCGVCHGAVGRVLGPGDGQLRRHDQLEAMAEIGLFAPGASAPALADPGDSRAPIEARARAYLHANCAHCHRVGGWQPPGLGLDLRAEIPLAEAGLCGVPLRYASPWAAGVWRLAPGSPEDSNLLHRMRLRGSGQMPPIATARRDEVGEAVVEAWIRALEGCPEEQ